MELYIINTDEVDLTRRMDYNFWVPRETMNNEDTSIPINECLGVDCLTTSAFYPAITPYYQTFDENLDDTIPFIRVGDTRKGLLDFKNTIFLSRELLDHLSKNIKRVRAGDVVITKGGEYIGEAALVPNTYPQYAICRDLLAIRIYETNSSELSGAYIAAYLQSSKGKSDLIRTRSVQGQPHLTLEKIYEIDIPILPKSIRTEIEDHYSTFFELVNESHVHLDNAEKILNHTFNNKLYRKKELSVYTKSIKQLELINRCDFDFYEKKWQTLVDELISDGINFHTVQYSKKAIPLDDPTLIYNYITLSDIDDRSGIINHIRELPTYDLPDRARRAVSTGDVLVSSLRGSRDKIAIIDETMPDNLVASTGFYVIRDKVLLPEVIYLLFRSLYYTLFIEQMASGAIMSSITEKYFRQLLLPNLSEDIQVQIAQEIRDYHRKRQDAFDSLTEGINKFN